LAISVRRGSANSRGEAAPQLRLTLLGGFQLSTDRHALRVVASAQRLLAFVALQDRPVTRLHAASTLWPDVSEDRARKSLRNSLWRLGWSGQTLIEAGDSCLRLAAHVSVDVRDLRRLARDELHAIESDVELEFDLSLFTGELLPGWFDEWLVVERELCHQMVLLMLERICQSLTLQARWPGAVMAGLAAVCHDPLRESAQRALIAAYLGQGNRGEAQRQYRAYCTVLARDLGIEPSDEIRSLLRSGDER
jgi:DNA-binding SARP family transcriptional activator